MAVFPRRKHDGGRLSFVLRAHTGSAASCASLCDINSRGGTIMRMRTVVVLFIGLLLNGCSLFGGGKNNASGLDLAAMQRAQWEELAKNGDSVVVFFLGLSFCCGFGFGLFLSSVCLWFCVVALL